MDLIDKAFDAYIQVNDEQIVKAEYSDIKNLLDERETLSEIYVNTKEIL